MFRGIQAWATKNAAVFATASENGAGKRTRTVDSHLGKVALYQLSYARIDFNRV